MNTQSTLLLVDDDEKAHFMMAALLEAEGYRLLQATSGEEGLALANEHHPDVVLLDVMMPKMDGFEVCRRLRESPGVESVPVVMLTAMDDRASRLRGLQAGADDYITKPFDGLELRTRLRTITRLNRFRRLYDERARFEAVVRAAPEGILVTEADGTVALANPAFVRLVQNVTCAGSLFDHVEAPHKDEWLAAVAACEAGQALPELRNARLVCRERGVDRQVELTGCVATWEGRSNLQLHVRDVTDQKRLEAQLLRSQRIELLGQVAGGVVHDVNNVLMAIMGYAELLVPVPEHGDALDGLKRSVRDAAALLRKILMFARGSEADMRAVDVAAQVNDIADIVRGTFGRIYTVNVDLGEPLPALRADPTNLHQILLNLCVNARDAMPDGGTLSLSGEAVTVGEEEATPHGGRGGPHVVLRVGDNGTGMDPEVQSHLFDPFFTTKAPDKGTGLGLATVLRLIRAHRGFVTVRSSVGEGSTFSCYFPLDVQPGA
jgi:two-component system, cell cycle sensor histidine kinase and response regulator CckA